MFLVVSVVVAVVVLGGDLCDCLLGQMGWTPSNKGPVTPYQNCWPPPPPTNGHAICHYLSNLLKNKVIYHWFGKQYTCVVD